MLEINSILKKQNKGDAIQRLLLLLIKQKKVMTKAKINLGKFFLIKIS